MDETMLVFLCVILFIFFLLVCLGVASAAQEIAVMKGHTSRKYFWYTLGMIPIGLSLVIALPDLYARPNASAPVVSSNEALPEL